MRLPTPVPRRDDVSLPVLGVRRRPPGFPGIDSPRPSLHPLIRSRRALDPSVDWKAGVLTGVVTSTFSTAVVSLGARFIGRDGEVDRMELGTIPLRGRAATRRPRRPAVAAGIATHQAADALPSRRPRRRLLAAGAAALLALAACGEGDGEAVPALTVEEAVVRAHNVGVARVSGTAIPVNEGAFVLAGDRRSIFVLDPRRDVGGVDPGEKVAVTGTVERMTGPLATELADQVAAADPADKLDRSLARLLLRARRHQGSPYIRPRELHRRDR